MNAPLCKPPANYTAYNQKLRTTLDEKLFFMNRLPSTARVFVDFGCAGGALLAELRRRHRTIAVCGYDIDSAMLDVAREQLSHQDMAAEYLLTDKWPAVERFIKTHVLAGHEVCIILSSVIHESCKDANEYAELLKKLHDTKAHYVAIRDMALEASVTPDRAKWLQAIMKLPYVSTPDHAKECEENYFPMSFEEYLNVSTVGSGYSLRHIDHTPLRWLQDFWMKHIGVHVTEPTHIKLLLKRRP